MPPGSRTRATSSHRVSTGCRLTTRSKEAEVNGSAGSSATATTCPPRGRSRSPRQGDVGRPRLGGHEQGWRPEDTREHLAAASLDIEGAPRTSPSAPPSDGRSPTAVAPRWLVPRTSRSPIPPPGRRRPPRPATRRSHLRPLRSERHVGGPMQRVDEALHVVAVRLDEPAEIAPLRRPGVRRGVGAVGELGERRRELGDVALDVLLRADASSPRSSL